MRQKKYIRGLNILLMMFFVFLVWTGSGWAAEGSTATVIGNVVNIRSTYSTSGDIITKVSKGEKLLVLGSKADWYQIKTKSGEIGWVADYLIEVKEIPKDDSNKNSEKSKPQVETNVSKGEVKIKLDGRLIEFDAAPYIDTQDRTMVPIRFVATELGSRVFWNETERLVTITGQGKIIQLWVEQATATVNGVDVLLDTVPVLKDGRTMIPLRFVGDNLGTKVGWDGTVNTVILTTSQPTPQIPAPNNDRSHRVALITSSSVNIRSGPGIEHEKINQVKKGDVLTVLGEAEDWYRVQSKDGQQGWVANWLVAIRTDQDAPSRSPDPGERPRPAPPVYTGPNTLQDIVAQDLGDKLEVHITGEHPLNYSMMSLGNPQRVVIDFYNTTLDLPWENEMMELDHNQLSSGLRVGQFTASQSRVVIDLKALASPSISLNAEGTELLLRLQPPSIKDKIIVLDPGHGSIQPGGWADPGAVGRSGLTEKDVVIDIAWKVQGILSKEKAHVIMTRTGDMTTLDLAGRADIANESKADIFVSIHANASAKPAIAGTSTYYYAPWDSLLGAQRVSRQRLASLVQQELVGQLGRRNIGVLESNFAVLRETKVPSILVETAFISNAEEEKLLADEEFRTRAAQGIANGIIRYFAEP